VHCFTVKLKNKLIMFNHGKDPGFWKRGGGLRPYLFEKLLPGPNQSNFMYKIIKKKEKNFLVTLIENKVLNAAGRLRYSNRTIRSL